jgi:DNA processing protein
MDYRLALLLQTYQGLKLSPSDRQSLFALTAAQSVEPALVEASLLSFQARAFLAKHPAWPQEAEDVLKLSAARGVRWSYVGQPDYPPLWNELSSQPLVFSYQGQPVWMEFPLISVVGSRTPMTETSLWMQREFSRFLRQTRAGVVSGGARGVDQWAHSLALAAGRPTVVVFPSGLLNPYPFGRDDLWEDVLLQDGCLLSTFPLHEPMHRHFFPTRNRWIAGFSRVTFIAEANRRSGSCLTANMALREGREIATLPVAPFAQQGLANLDLLRDGATLISHAGDLSAAIGRSRDSCPRTPQSLNSEQEEQSIDGPQRNGGGNPAIARDSCGREIEDPIGDQENETNHETTTFGGAPVGHGSQPDPEKGKDQTRAGQ